jgi:hypothetical protein
MATLVEVVVRWTGGELWKETSWIGGEDHNYLDVHTALIETTKGIYVATSQHVWSGQGKRKVKKENGTYASPHQWRKTNCYSTQNAVVRAKRVSFNIGNNQMK